MEGRRGRLAQPFAGYGAEGGMPAQSRPSLHGGRGGQGPAPRSPAFPGDTAEGGGVEQGGAQMEGRGLQLSCKYLNTI